MGTLVLSKKTCKKIQAWQFAPAIPALEYGYKVVAKDSKVSLTCHLNLLGLLKDNEKEILSQKPQGR